MYICLNCEKEVMTSSLVCDCGNKLVKTEDSQVDGLIIKHRKGKKSKQNTVNAGSTIVKVQKKVLIDEKIEDTVNLNIQWVETHESLSNSKKWVSTNPQKLRGVNYWLMLFAASILLIISPGIPYVELKYSGLVVILSALGMLLFALSGEYLLRYVEREKYDRLPISILVGTLGVGVIVLFNILLCGVVKYELILANNYNARYSEVVTNLIDVYIINCNAFIFLVMSPIVLVAVGILSFLIAVALFKFLSEMMRDTNIHQSSKTTGVVTGIINTALDGRSAGIGSAARGFLFGYGISALIQIIFLLIVFGVIVSLGVSVLSLPLKSVKLLGDFVFNQTKGPFSFAGLINSILILTTVVLAAINLKVNGSDYSDYNFWAVKRTHLTYSFVGLNLVWIPLIYFFATL